MLAQKAHDYTGTSMACLKVDVKSNEKDVLNKTSISIIFVICLSLAVKVPFCLLNDAVLVEEIRQGRRI
jgi:hypothetical protein